MSSKSTPTGAQDAAAGGGVLGAFGAIMQGNSTANALQAEANLQIQNAQEAEAQGVVDAQKSQINSGARIGNAVANYGASGVTSTSGSVLSVLSASASNAEMDRLNILHGADIKAINYQNQASMERLGAQSAITGSEFSAAGDLISGGVKAAGMGA